METDTLVLSLHVFKSEVVLVAEIVCCISTVPVARKLMCLLLEINAHLISLKMTSAITDKCSAED